MARSRRIRVGGVVVGGGAPVSVQSMTNTDTRDPVATLAQIAELTAAGCQIVRVAVPDEAATRALTEISSRSPVPVIADIHFNHKLALAAVEAGVAAIRVNPGNFGGAEEIRQVAMAAGGAGIPVRVGANSGSLPRDLSGAETPETMAQSLVTAAVRQCRLLEDNGFNDIKVSLKASSVRATVLAYRQFAAATDYPLHLGVTEAGTPAMGVVKSAVGIGALLLDGIGDTIRVSLTANPVEEVKTGIRILKALGLRDGGIEVVACPTCGRTGFDLISLTERVETIAAEIEADKSGSVAAKIAVMGCAVNGPGEAKDADFGLAGAEGGRLVAFRKGEVVQAFDIDDALTWLERELTEHHEEEE